jgi:SAM-dependent methyltransferase
MNDPTTRFSDRVADYRISRPGYPQGLVPLLARETGLTPAWIVADLGAGTGLSALPFLEHGNRVLGIEPNEAMRRAGEETLAEHPGYEAHEGTAEATGLPHGSVDLVLAAQAFHWFRPVAAAAEASRILRPGGWRVVLWNTRVQGIPFMDAYEDFLLEHGTDYRAVRHDHVLPDALATFLGAPPLRFTLENSQAFDREGLRARVRSSSYTPAPGAPGHREMMEALDALFDVHAAAPPARVGRGEAGPGGDDRRVTFLYETEIYLPHLL